MGFLFSVTLMFVTFINAQGVNVDQLTPSQNSDYQVEVNPEPSIQWDGNITQLSEQPEDKEQTTFYFPKFYYLGIIDEKGHEVVADWMRDGFLVVKSDANQDEIQKIRYSSVAIKEAVADKIRAGQEYSILLNNFMMKPTSYQLISIQDLRFHRYPKGDLAYACMSVQWHNKEVSRFTNTINFCGDVELGGNGSGFGFSLKLSNWRANGMWDEFTGATTQELAEDLLPIAQATFLGIYSHPSNARDLITYIRTGQGTLN